MIRRRLHSLARTSTSAEVLNHRIVNSGHASSAPANRAFDEFAKELAFVLAPAARAGRFLQTLASGEFLTSLQDKFYGWA